MNLDFKTLTNKVLTKEATDEETKQFDQLISSNVELFNEYKQIKERLEQVDKLEPIIELDIENDWNFVSKSIKKRERFHYGLHGRNSDELSVLDMLLRIAAIIVIISGLSFWLIKITSTIDTKEKFTVIKVPYGAKNTVELADGTVVDLNSGSQLKISTDFNKENRTVNLEGEAYFDVTKSKLPFIVKTTTLDIKVHGTKFNIKTYKEEKFVETTLLEGSLTVNKKNEGTNKIRMLKLVPNQKLIFDKQTDNMVLLTVEKLQEAGQENHESVKPKIDIEQLEKDNSIPIVQISDEKEIESSIAWKKGLVFLNQETLENFAIKLERMYDIKIEFENEEIKKYTISGTLRQFTIEQLLDGLMLMLPINYKIKDNKVIIYKKK